MALMDPSALVTKQTKQFNNVLKKQNQKQNTYFDKYSSAVNAQPTLVNTLENAQQARGVGDLQNGINVFKGEMTNVKGLLDRLDENTASRTEGTGANQAYLDRLRASEGGQLNTQLSRLGAGLEPVTQAYGLASQDIGQLLTATQTDQENALKPLEMRINSLGDRFAREITGFTNNKQNQLDVLLTKVQRQQQLSDREWQAAQSLAAEERAYQRQREETAQEQAYNKSLIELANRNAAKNKPKALPSSKELADTLFGNFGINMPGSQQGRIYE